MFTDQTEHLKQIFTYIYLRKEDRQFSITDYPVLLLIRKKMTSAPDISKSTGRPSNSS